MNLIACSEAKVINYTSTDPYPLWLMKPTAASNRFPSRGAPMNIPPKTNAMRMLEKAGIVFRVVTYEVDEGDLSRVHVAQSCGLPVEQVFKTLVVQGDRTGYVVACIQVGTELDLKALAAASGNKTCEMIAVKELLPLTGYIRGGCSPIGMKKVFPTFFDETAMLFDWVSVSAGMRGAQILTAPQALIEFIGAEVADIAR